MIEWLSKLTNTTKVRYGVSVHSSETYYNLLTVQLPWANEFNTLVYSVRQFNICKLIVYIVLISEVSQLYLVIKWPSLSLVFYLQLQGMTFNDREKIEWMNFKFRSKADKFSNPN